MSSSHVECPLLVEEVHGTQNLARCEGVVDLHGAAWQGRNQQKDHPSIHPSGVRRCHAVQAGRELRVFVDPAQLSNKGAQKLAREVAREVEAKTSPGEVQVTVIREVRHIEIAC